MKRLFKKISNWINRQWLKVKPGSNAINGASKTLIYVILFFWVYFTINLAIETKDPWIMLFGLFLLLVVVLSALLTVKVLRVLYLIPKQLKIAIFLAIPLLIISLQNPILALFFVCVIAALGAAIYVVKRTGFKTLSMIKKVVVIVGFVLGLGGLIAGFISYNTAGYDLDEIANAAKLSGDKIEPLSIGSPADEGTYTVKEITYGSGIDKRREEFGKDVFITTEPVNGVAFIDNWEGFSGWAREKYWGFDSKSLPINGRVWYPEGDGPFPLVLIVHGNHIMSDYSDVGYGYLGELLASRGIIFASVDQNFINGAWSDFFGGLEKENDARGWLLLEHLRVWHDWNTTQDNHFYNKIDTNNIALIGHSRGGEAVGHAAMFNSLTHYPDDASIKLDYNYNIKSVVAIAPVDGQYKPGDSGTKFENVDYFVIHGSQDGDVRSYMGAQQYERIQFTDSLYHLKSGLYVYGANHGQFNSSWGKNDLGAAFNGLLNLKQLMPQEEQEEIAKVYISAFLEATLKDNKAYLPLFVDARKGKNWLPDTIYLNQFQDSNSDFICSFDEDFDVLTSTKKGEITTNGLTVWREEEIDLKWQKKGSRAVVLGWNFEDDTAQTDGTLVRYDINLDSTAVSIDSNSAFVFSMAESTESSNPKTKGKWLNNKEEKASNAEENKEEEIEKEEEATDTPKEPIDFSIQFTDVNGEQVDFLLSNFSGLQREIETVVMKVDFLTGEKESEKIFQTFYFPLETILKNHQNFDSSKITKVSFIFNKTKSGVVVIDDIGFTKAL